MNDIQEQVKIENVPREIPAGSKVENCENWPAEEWF
jgi:hypothetical protein